MAKNAQELADVIVELNLKDKQKAYDLLRTKCIAATESMIKDRNPEVVVDIDLDEGLALERVTDELRQLGYKFRFIEKVKENGDVVSHSLLISVAHCIQSN